MTDPVIEELAISRDGLSITPETVFNRFGREIKLRPGLRVKAGSHIYTQDTGWETLKEDRIVRAIKGSYLSDITDKKEIILTLDLV